MVKRKQSSQRNRRKMAMYGLLLLLMAGIVWLAWHHYRPKPKVSPVPTPTITSLPTTSSGSPEKNVSTPGGNNSGNATDNNGQANSPVTTSPSQWTQSQSGVIVVKQPGANSKISSGALLFGTAKASKVQYRLIDNQTGVISQGFINVVNNNFSANLNFTSHGSSGRLDVFTADDNGVESNEVQIGVSF